MVKEDTQPPQLGNVRGERQEFKLTKGRKVKVKKGFYTCNGCGGHKKTPANFLCPVCDGKGVLPEKLY